MRIACLTLLGLAAGCGAAEDAEQALNPPPPPVANKAPVVSAPIADQSALVGYAFSYDAAGGAAFSDPDGDPLTISVAIEGEANGLSLVGGVVSGAPRAPGRARVAVTARDPEGLTVTDAFDIAIGVDQNAVLETFDGKIDLMALANYAAPPIPDYITRRGDGANPVTDAGATLGRALFYDVKLSFDESLSCASCHKQEFAFGDDIPYSFGVGDTELPRHSSRLVNAQYAEETKFFWDERAESLEAQVIEPIKSGFELGFDGRVGRPDFDDFLERLAALEHYQELFRFTFGDPQIAEERVALSLGQFVRSIASFDSRWDEGRAQVASHDAPFPNFTADENAGKTLFTLSPAEGGAGCAACHRPPEFDIDPDALFNGVATVLDEPTQSDFTNTRAPSLRDLATADGVEHGFYMHDGEHRTLRAVIDHYDDVRPTAEADPSEFAAQLDARLKTGGAPQRLSLSETEKTQLEAYLLTLGGERLYEDDKWASPFPVDPF